MSRQLGSRYTLVAPLGRGAMGEVWRGTDTDGNPLAFKVLHESLTGDPATVQRFLQERAILTGLDHPSLVRVRDLVAEGSTLAIVMDLVEGGDLRTVLASHRVLPPAEACRIGAEVAAGLAAVHAAGVVHRDIKPENILLDPQVRPPAVRLTDFGIAKLAEQTSSGRSTMLVGTPSYLAPEVFDGQPPSPASDLYGLGILLYEMCCGVTPFAGESALAVLRQHADHAPGRPAGVPDPLWDLIWHLLAKDPATRPAPAGRVSNVLTALAHDLAGAPPAPPLAVPPLATPMTVHRRPTELTGAGPAPVPARTGSTLRLLLVTLVAVAVVAAGLGGWAIARTGGDGGTVAGGADPAGPASSAPAAPATADRGPESSPTPPAAPATSPPGVPESPLPGPAPIDVLPPPPSDPGVPYRSGTASLDDYYNLDTGGFRYGGRDLSLEAAGLAAQNGAVLARWSGDEPPLPSECHAVPYREWALFLAPDQLGVDDTFCYLTAGGRYGYFEVRVRDITEEGDLRRMTFTYLTWSLPADL